MESLINKEIREAVNNLSSKLQRLNLYNLDISAYNKKYLKQYIDNYSFYMFLYSQLLLKAIKKLNRPISESTFVDYGGGCGILSYLAKEIGFKVVVYNDIYQVSINDTQTISKSIGITIDHYICGGVEDFVKEIKLNSIKPDLICSFDVLEHIYDLEKWFEKIADIESGFSLLFMTSANSNNPYIVNRLKKLHIKAEYKGLEKTIGWKEIDLNTSFLETRKNIISKKFPKLKNDEVKKLSLKTRGLRKDDIEKVVKHYLESGKINYQIKHPTNTCDPYSGNWTENLIDLKRLKILIKNNNLIVDVTNSTYAYSNNGILNIPKYILNQIIHILGPRHLLFSPTYTLEIQKN